MNPEFLRAKDGMDRVEKLLSGHGNRGNSGPGHQDLMDEQDEEMSDDFNGLDHSGDL
jgi:hypothetical protein